MGNVVQFHGNAERDWRVIEGGIKECLIELHVPEDARDRLLIRLRPFCEALISPASNFSIPIDFHGPMPEARASAICADLGQKIGKRIDDKLSDLQRRLIRERIQREIQDARDDGLL